MRKQSLTTIVIFGVILAVMYLLFAPGAFGQNTNPVLGEKLKDILKSQTLPDGYEKLPYISFASLSGALDAYDSMPKPTYIIPKSSIFSMTGKETDGKLVTIYRVYFTPKPGTAYEVPKGKIVRYAKTASDNVNTSMSGFAFASAGN